MVQGTMGVASKIVTTPLLVALLMVGGPGLGLGATTPNEGEGASAALSVLSDPVGAAVYVDGVRRGVTPLEIDALDVGEHRVTLLKDNYLENSRIVTLKSGQKESMSVELTDSAGARYSMQIGTSSGGGGSKLPLILGIAGGGAAAAFFLLRNTNDPPVAGSVSVSPSGPGLEDLTSFSFTASGASDPDGDALSFSWDFGDGGTGSGQSTSHVYSLAGSYTVSVTVSDGEESASATGSVTVKSMDGRWTGRLTNGSAVRFTWTLTQSGSSVAGQYSDQFNGSGSATGSVSSSLRVTLTNQNPGFRLGRWTGTLTPNLDRVNGTTDFFGGSIGFFIERQ